MVIGKDIKKQARSFANGDGLQCSCLQRLELFSPTV